MKKRHIFTIVTCAIAAIFFTCVLVIGMAAGPAASVPSSAGPRTHTNSKDLDLEEYDIDSLDINWLAGPVTVGLSPDGQVHITERSSKALDESERMKVEVSSGTLKIRWDDQWFRKFVNIDFGWFDKKDKELEVLLPWNTALALVTLDVGNVSDKLSVSGCTAEEMSISTVSGSLVLTSCAAENLNASTVSGDVTMTDVSASEAMSVNTVSGGMELTGVTAGELTLDTVSGGCTLGGQARELKANTISGNVTASLRSVPEDVDMDAVSGALRLELPSSASFTVEHDSVSGSFKCEFSTEDLGGHRLRCGSGGAGIRMNTTSGSMDIRRGDN